jgi:hypothetical protein
VTPTHIVADGMHCAIIRATRSTDAVPALAAAPVAVAETGCCARAEAAAAAESARAAEASAPACTTIVVDGSPTTERS